MAFFELHFYSDALKRAASVNVILPESSKTLIGMKTVAEPTYKTLYLLHGLSDDHTIWSRRTSIERYAAEYGIAVVMPNGARSWYTDMADGSLYFTHITQELPMVCQNFFRGMSNKREDNFIGGLSMGGYGAMKAALTFPERYGGCICLSGALDIAAFGPYVTIEEWRAIFGYDLDSFESLRTTKHDVYNLAQHNKSVGKEFTKTYMWCGNDDFLLDNSIRFHNLLSDLGIAHKYEQTEGDHAWNCWDEHIRDGIEYLLS